MSVDEEEDKALAVDRYVFRSIPINMFRYPRMIGALTVE